MIIHLKKEIAEAEAQKIAVELEAMCYHNGAHFILITPSATKELKSDIVAKSDGHWAMDTDIQLASRKYLDTLREIKWGNTTIGGKSNNTPIIAGPCSIESWEQIEQSAALLKSLGINTLRAGCYKPRTSPYSFQGLGLEGLKMLAEVRKKHGLNIITEVKDSSHVNEVIEYADIVQIGAKAMYDQSILRRCGEARKPILLKRGFGSTLQEFVAAATNK
jgi:3-deoxy-7-phosphoheptulonate synthase